MRPRNLIVQGAGHGISSLTSMIHLRHLDCPSVHVNLRSLRRYRLCPSFRVVHAGRKSRSILFTSRDGLEVWSGNMKAGTGARWTEGLPRAYQDVCSPDADSSASGPGPGPGLGPRTPLLLPLYVCYTCKQSVPWTLRPDEFAASLSERHARERAQFGP